MLFENVKKITLKRFLNHSQMAQTFIKAELCHLHFKNMLAVIQKDDSESKHAVFLRLSCVFRFEELRLLSPAAHVAL